MPSLETAINLSSIIGIIVAVCIEVVRSRRISRLWREHLRRLAQPTVR